MFVFLISYTEPREAVEALLPDHLAWLEVHHGSGRFVVSGPRDDGTGGVIVVSGEDRAEAETLAASDPFVRGAVARSEVVQFRASQTAPGLAPG